MKHRLIFIALIALSVVALISVALKTSSPALADGATQITGTAYFPGPGECTDAAYQDSDFSSILHGDMEGCIYTYVESAECTPSGVYHESGHEVFVNADGGGTFRTTYFFQAKYKDCPNLINEVVGRCQHPIVDGSGTGVFEGVSGRLHFKDDIEEGNFPYQGHLNWVGSP